MFNFKRIEKNTYDVFDGQGEYNGKLAINEREWNYSSKKTIISTDYLNYLVYIIYAYEMLISLLEEEIAFTIESDKTVIVKGDEKSRETIGNILKQVESRASNIEFEKTHGSYSCRLKDVTKYNREVIFEIRYEN